MKGLISEFTRKDKYSGSSVATRTRNFGFVMLLSFTSSLTTQPGLRAPSIIGRVNSSGRRDPKEATNAHECNWILLHSCGV